MIVGIFVSNFLFHFIFSLLLLWFQLHWIKQVLGGSVSINNTDDCVCIIIKIINSGFSSSNTFPLINFVVFIHCFSCGLLEVMSNNKLNKWNGMFRDMSLYRFLCWNVFVYKEKEDFHVKILFLTWSHKSIFRLRTLQI